MFSYLFNLMYSLFTTVFNPAYCFIAFGAAGLFIALWDIVSRTYNNKV